MFFLPLSFEKYFIDSHHYHFDSFQIGKVEDGVEYKQPF